MLRLKGVTIFGETKEFYVDRVVAIDGADGKWWVEIGNKTYVLDPATIQLANLDPHLVALMEGLEIPDPDFWSKRTPDELKLVGKTIARQANLHLV